MGKETFLARQPIVDAEHRLFAYELLFRQSMSAVSAQITSQLQAGVEIISNTLCLGPDWLLQGKLAFINLDEATLMSDFVCLLPPRHVVYEILETVAVTPVLIARIRELRQLGYRFALDDFVCLDEYRPLLPMVDFVKLDVLEQPPEKTAEIIAHIRLNFTGQFIAEKVESREMFDLCRNCGIEYFQGYYFAHPENLASKTIQPGQLAVLELMNKVRACEDLAEIEEPLRRNAALTLRLLRYANSAASGLQQHAHTVRQALTQIGLKTLYRWLALLLITANPTPTNALAARTAVTRGRICELLGRSRFNREAQDELFITGLFSLAEPLMEIPLARLLEFLPMPDPIVQALVHQTGPYAPFLKLAEASERSDFEQIARYADEIASSPEEVNLVQLQSLAWAEALTSEAPHAAR
ncbi:MAG TPA: EAL domain-containing protein [Thiobacillus sp.]|nr:MAG: EAL domain-containing protein [Hydrogenophilales bacterium 16-64-40]OZA34394.1 MAG: EAL domain-containing protein [Hydrogenophilales bacterium 17-64-65]HQS81666.1 EAL domain-containing protein [Thiobacillus sp.]HQT33099.1 EAL domain-containing protein [Thiobacillus sp.]